MRYSYYPQSLVRIWGADRGIGIWIWGVDLRGVVHPKHPGLTGQTGAHHRSDWCKSLLGFSSGEVLVCSLVSKLLVVSSLELFGAREVCFLDLEFSGLDWSNRCVVLALPV
jgi:hypothetical protein